MSSRRRPGEGTGGGGGLGPVAVHTHEMVRAGGWDGLHSLKEDSVLVMEPDSLKQPPLCLSVLRTFDIFLIFGKRSFKTPPPTRRP